MRSKHKRKMRAVKRVRYSEKELTRLKDMVAKTEERELGEAFREAVEDATNAMEVSQKPMAGIELLTPGQMKKLIKSSKKKAKKEDALDQDATMKSDDEQDDEVIRNSKTLKDDQGKLPGWLNGRQKKRHEKKLRRLKKAAVRKSKK